MGRKPKHPDLRLVEGNREHRRIDAACGWQVQISVSADADLGDGVRTLTGFLDLEIVSGEAVSLGVIAGAPREQAL